MKLLVADIGGTNARFGYQKNKESEIEHIEFFNCVDFKNIDHAISHYIVFGRLKTPASASAPKSWRNLQGKGI